MDLRRFKLLLCLGVCAAGISLRAQESVPPKATTPESHAAAGNYVLTPNDTILLRVYQEDDLSGQYRLSADGTITVPLIGTVRLGGKTIDESQRQLNQAFKEYLRNPQASIAVVVYSKRRFSLLGQVQRPGTYLIPNEETLDLLTAIASAGGFTPRANLSNVIIKRMEGGREVVLKFNAKAMAQRDDKSVEVRPGDTITVGEKIF